MGALHGWNWAKALYLQSLLGEPQARDHALRVLDQAIRRGGRSAWFNRMRASLNRARADGTIIDGTASDDYAAVLLRTFDDLLEQTGRTGQRYERFCNRIDECLSSNSHAEFQEGLERLGKVLGYTAFRPRHGAATDCLWRGVFGNTREVVTFEAKIEQVPATLIAAGDIGQAHNQMSRAVSQYHRQGFVVRGTIVTHLDGLELDAEASAGDIKVIPRAAIVTLWRSARTLLNQYRGRWSLDDLSARLAAAELIRGELPGPGWLSRALDCEARFVTSDDLLSKWRD